MKRRGRQPADAKPVPDTTDNPPQQATQPVAAPARPNAAPKRKKPLKKTNLANRFGGLEIEDNDE